MLCLYFICELKLYARTYVNFATLEINSYTGFPLSRNFYVRTRVKLKQRQYRMVVRRREVKLRTTFTFTRDTSLFYLRAYFTFIITGRWKSTLKVNFH